jgi:hypothetical protein
LRVIESDATNRRIVLEVLTKPERKPGQAAAAAAATPEAAEAAVVPEPAVAAPVAEGAAEEK